MFLLLASLASCQNYAFLYAGSAAYFNYRHQADIFTIYNQLLDRGFSKDQILLCAYDDIARSSSNPFQNEIFHSLDHKVNVYPGKEALNHRGGEVNARLFLNTVSNFPTTSADNVFIYYDNHGGPNLLGTPTGELISAHNLLSSFKKAETKKLYKQVLFIIEACYSGSVGQVLTNLTNVAIITAANNAESSYAAVYDSEVGSYLTNEFTNYFCSLIDEKPDITIGELFTTIKEEMQQSHPCFFGDESIQSIQISDFIGKPNNNKYMINHNKDKASFQLAKPKEATTKTLDHLAENPKAYIRAKARLEKLRIKAQTEKLEAVLDLLVNYVDPKNYEEIMNDNESDATPTYYSILPVFVKQFGEINPDDYGRFNVLKALAARHTKAEIILGIFAVVF